MGEIKHGIHLGRFSAGIFSADKGASSTVVKQKEDDSGEKYVKWGEDNQYPQEFLTAYRKNGAAAGGMKILKSTHYGEGFVLYKNDFTDGQKKETLIDVNSLPEIKEFLRVNKMSKTWIEIIADLEMFSFALPEFIVSNNFEKITRVKRQRVAFGRFAQMNKQGLIEKVYLKADWTESQIDKDTAKVDLIDPYWNVDEIKSYLKKKKIHKFIMPVAYPLVDESYYAQTDWHASYRNGWFEVSNSVAKLKKYIFENQLHIKYVIYISEKYFEKYYGEDWESYKIKKRETIRRELMTAIDEHLSGNEAGGRSINSPIFLDDNGNWVKGIEVESIDNKLKDGSYLPDASAANSEILFAMGVDPSLVGAGTPGGKLGAGSGSDKREAYTILVSLFKSKRETTLEIWELIRDYNGWDTSLNGAFPNTILTTLDKNPTGKETKI